MSKAPSVDHQILSSNLNADFVFYLRGNPIGKVIPTPGVIFGEITCDTKLAKSAKQMNRWEESDEISFTI